MNRCLKDGDELFTIPADVMDEADRLGLEFKDYRVPSPPDRPWTVCIAFCWAPTKATLAEEIPRRLMAYGSPATGLASRDAEAREGETAAAD